MNALEAHQEYGAEWAREVAEAAGTSYGCFKQIMYRFSRPSPVLANKISLNSEGVIDFESLVRYRKRTPKKCG